MRFAVIGNGLYVRTGSVRRRRSLRPAPPIAAVPSSAPCTGCGTLVPSTKLLCPGCAADHEAHQRRAIAACTCGRDGFQVSCGLGEHRALAAENAAEAKARGLRIARAQAGRIAVDLLAGTLILSIIPAAFWLLTLAR